MWDLNYAEQVINKGWAPAYRATFELLLFNTLSNEELTAQKASFLTSIRKLEEKIKVTKASIEGYRTQLSAQSGVPGFANTPLHEQHLQRLGWFTLGLRLYEDAVQEHRLSVERIRAEQARRAKR